MSNREEFRRAMAAETGAERIARRFRCVRETTGLSQSSVAAKACIDQGTVSRLENAQKWWEVLCSLERIAQAMGHRVDLLPVEEETS